MVSGRGIRLKIDLALKRAIERNTMRVIPVAIPKCPRSIDLPPYLQVRQLVDLRNYSSWSRHLLQCAITGARPGRRDHFEASLATRQANQPGVRGRLLLTSCKVKSMRTSYTATFRVANSSQSHSQVVDKAMLRVHLVARHPIPDELSVYLAPIRQTRAPRAIQVALRTGPIYTSFERDHFLTPGEVEDLTTSIKVAPGVRALCSTGVLWSFPGEPLARLSEVGYFTIGHRGIYSDGEFAYPPPARDTYAPGQHPTAISEFARLARRLAEYSVPCRVGALWGWRNRADDN